MIRDHVLLSKTISCGELKNSMACSFKKNVAGDNAIKLSPCHMRSHGGRGTEWTVYIICWTGFLTRGFYLSHIARMHLT